MIDLLAKAVDVDFNQIRLAVEVTVPHVLDDFAPRHSLRRAEQEELQEGEFLGGQRDRL